MRCNSFLIICSHKVIFRNHENFTSLLQEETITYRYKAGQEEVLINGLSIEEFLSANTTKHEFIRKHCHTATRNFDKRVKSFIKTIVMNSFSPLRTREFSYRVEFQMRGKKSLYDEILINLSIYCCRGSTSPWDLMGRH